MGSFPGLPQDHTGRWLPLQTLSGAPHHPRATSPSPTRTKKTTTTCLQLTLQRRSGIAPKGYHHPRLLSTAAAACHLGNRNRNGHGAGGFCCSPGHARQGPRTSSPGRPGPATDHLRVPEPTAPPDHSMPAGRPSFLGVSFPPWRPPAQHVIRSWGPSRPQTHLPLIRRARVGPLPAHARKPGHYDLVFPFHEHRAAPPPASSAVLLLPRQVKHVREARPDINSAAPLPTAEHPTAPAGTGTQTQEP